MSEKQFWKMETFQGFCDIFHNDTSICSVRVEYADNLVNLLNQLSEESEELKIRNQYNLEDCGMEIAELRKENEQLRILLDDVDNESIVYEEKIEKLEKENEQLDKENKKLQEEIEELKRDRDSWKTLLSSHMKRMKLKDSLKL